VLLTFGSRSPDFGLLILVDEFTSLNRRVRRNIRQLLDFLQKSVQLTASQHGANFARRFDTERISRLLNSVKLFKQMIEEETNNAQKNFVLDCSTYGGPVGGGTRSK
jgi:hypothetical protein